MAVEKSVRMLLYAGKHCFVGLPHSSSNHMRICVCTKQELLHQRHRHRPLAPFSLQFLWRLQESTLHSGIFTLNSPWAHLTVCFHDLLMQCATAVICSCEHRCQCCAEQIVTTPEPQRDDVGKFTPRFFPTHGAI